MEEMRGFRRLFLVGLGVFTFASLAGGLAPSPIALIVARIVQGVGGAAYRATHSAVYAPSRAEPSRRATSSIRSWRSAPVAERGDTAIRAR